MSAVNLYITVAGVEHAAVLTSLSITTFVESFAKDNTKENMDKYVADEMNEQKIAEELTDRDNIFFLAWHHGLLTGYAKLRTVKIPTGLEQNKPLEIERIYVLKEHHGKKIGAALMHHCIAYGVNNGHDVVWLGVADYNKQAVSFYERWGFEYFGTHAFRLGDDIQMDLLMKKRL